MGTLLSLITSYLLSVEVLTGYEFRWDLPILVVVSVVALSIITADFGARSALRQKPARLLQEG